MTTDITGDIANDTSKRGTYLSRDMLMQVARPVIVIGTLLLIWEMMARGGWINTFLFPPPSVIGWTLWREMTDGSLMMHILRSLYRLLAGLGLAIVLGTLIGIAIGMTRWGRAIFKPIISALMPVPTLAWTPVLLLAVGINDRTTILVVFIAASFEVIYNVVSGIESMNVRTFWVARSMGATRLQIFWKIIIPGVLAYLITGIKLGTGYAWRALIAAEMLAASSYGLGFMIYDASEYMTMGVIYGGIVTIALLGYVIENVLLGLLEANTIQKWGVNVVR